LIVATVATLFFVPVVFAAIRGRGRDGTAENQTQQARRTPAREEELVFAQLMES